MSHTGQVHDGDQMAGSRSKKIMVITEGDKISKGGITYYIPFHDKTLDISGSCKLADGTPVSFRIKDGKASKVKKLRYTHFLYDIIDGGIFASDIKQNVAKKIERLSRDKKKVKVISHDQKTKKGPKTMNLKIQGFKLLDTTGVKDTGSNHSSDEEHLIIP